MNSSDQLAIALALAAAALAVFCTAIPMFQWKTKWPRRFVVLGGVVFTGATIAWLFNAKGVLAFLASVTARGSLNLNFSRVDVIAYGTASLVALVSLLMFFRRREEHPASEPPTSNVDALLDFYWDIFRSAGAAYLLALLLAYLMDPELCWRLLSRDPAALAALSVLLADAIEQMIDRMLDATKPPQSKSSDSYRAPTPG